ncbi:protein white-like isoform X1 [Penaeus chinensis]|uniref:protein white-like isoform X1 n=1 Tax=Penaeus chinensis TaxID=139456 RepID=UPI001FB72791|nr:protein white-like isoform X1 [Penaeus chinensis]
MSDVKGLSIRRRTDQTFENIELNDANGQQPVDPSAGVAYAWRDLNVYAGGRGLIKKSPEVHILKNVSGLCEGGQLLAIMGASGAGKTTLLNVLTFRTSKLRITGDIYINGRPVDMRTIAGVSAYVQQEDLFTGVFTVREQLNFNAQLRIGKEISQRERTQRVEEVIKELGLGKCANTKIGIPGRIKGISGGEKKRLAFACEMITNPLLLLCDEPTSGLDSFMAQSVVNAMKRLTSLGKTVIATIHQPSSEVFALFDRLLILAEGRVAFLGTVREAHKFFTRLERPCPSNYSPGDHFIYSLAIRAGEEEQCRQFVHHVCDSYRDNEAVDVQKQLDRAMQPPVRGDALAHVKLPKSPYRASWGNQFLAMFRRTGLELMRDPLVSIIRLIQGLFFAIVFGLIYLDTDGQDPEFNVMAQNISGMLFTFTTNLSFSNLFPVVTVFSGLMPLFLREHWNGLYRTDIFFLTRSLLELPVFVMGPVGFTAIIYYMVGLRPEAQYFFTAMGILTLVANVAVSYGYMISCLAKNYQTALVLSTPLTLPIMLFGGFFVQADSIPPYLDWLSYLSWFQYGFEALTINQWDGYGVSLGNVTVDAGPIIFKRLGFSADNFWIDIGALFGLLVGFRILAFLFLLLKSRR